MNRAAALLALALLCGPELAAGHELDYGDWDGRKFADVSPEEWAQWRRDVSFAPPGGESLESVTARIGANP